MSVIERAIALRAEANSHNRMSRWHKSQARVKMAALARFCEENGIEIKIVKAKMAETEENNG